MNHWIRLSILQTMNNIFSMQQGRVRPAYGRHDKQEGEGY